jgi:hypothetical protein
MKGNSLWLLGTVAVIAVVVVVGWFLGIAPRLAEADSAALEVASVQQLNATQQAELAALQEQDAALDDLRDQLRDLRLAIPTSAQAEDFIDEVAAAAARAGVNIKSIRFEDPGPWGAAPVTEGTPTETTDGESTIPPPYPTAPDGVFTVAVSIEIVGNPLASITFSRLLQEGERLFLSDGFRFAAQADERATITGFLFIYADPNAQADETEGSPGSTPSPDPSATPTPDPTESSTPSPTPAP